jgi:hypothetical protein
VHVACTYSQIGSFNINLNGLVSSETGNTTPFDIHFDVAPRDYITGNPARNSAVPRELERDFAKLTAVDPITRQTDKLAVALADPVEMGFLQMVSEPDRGPDRSGAATAESSQCVRVRCLKVRAVVFAQPFQQNPS